MVRFSIKQLLDGVDERDSRRQYLIHLRRILTERFGEGELKTLCFDLGIDHQDLPVGHADKARELLTYCDRHNRIPALVQYGKRARPDISWDDLSRFGGAQ